MNRADYKSATEAVKIADAVQPGNEGQTRPAHRNAAILAAWLARARLYLQLVRLDRPIGSLLLVWPTLWALWIASNGRPSWWHIVAFVAGTVVMRSAGCAVNDFADRDFDRHVERTRNRPITSGRISPGEALVVATALALVGFALVLTLDDLARWLSLPALGIAASYPFTKRFFPVPQAYLGIAFGFGIPMAFAAETGSIPTLAWLLLAANVLWTIAYDTEYAMVDRDDDLRIGIRSSAITFGRADVVAVMSSYAMSLGLLVAVGITRSLGTAYYLGLAVAAVIASYHFTLIRTRSKDGCFRAFRHNNWFGAAIFAGLYIDFWLRR